MRNAIKTPKAKTFKEFLIGKIRGIEAEGKEITLGTMTDGIWQEYETGESWDTVRVGSIWEEPKFITLAELKREHEFIVEQFETRMDTILGY